MGPTTTLFKKKLLKMNLTALFTHLKIILLFSKINCIQMNHNRQESYNGFHPYTWRTSK